jgi:S1-C subfamily serine protease
MAKSRAEKARVRLPEAGGQGVLVTGGFILTATHCIKWSGTGGMTLGDYYIENVTTKNGGRLRARPLAADPLSDMAVLGPLDDQEFKDDFDKFEIWCEATEGVPLVIRLPWPGRSLDVHVLTHKDRWIAAKITNYRYGVAGSRIAMEANDQIEGGTSGGPVIDSNGELVGVVSSFNEAQEGRKCNGAVPVARWALPHWVLMSIAKKAAATRWGARKGR